MAGVRVPDRDPIARGSRVTAAGGYANPATSEIDLPQVAADCLSGAASAAGRRRIQQPGAVADSRRKGRADRGAGAVLGGSAHLFGPAMIRRHAGIDTASIAHWLSHATVQTTRAHLQADRN